MAITITRADVKRKCMIATSDTTYDSAIDSLISEMQPALEYGIADQHLADTGNTGLQATLKLGMLEIISGETLEQICREVGASEEFTISGLTLGERKERGSALIQQGTERLVPYLKSGSDIASTTEDAERVMADPGVW